MGNFMSDQKLPLYDCHKRVEALQIQEVIRYDSGSSQPENEVGSALIVPSDKAYTPFRVSTKYVLKHDPKAGGYYVRYEDGYESWSPSDVFENGYRLAVPADPPQAA